MEKNSFSEDRINSVIRAIEKDNSLVGRVGQLDLGASSDAEYVMLAECISVNVEDGKVCLRLPLGIGKECLDIPDWIPDGEAARACISIVYKTILGVKIPTGVNACVYVANQEITCVRFSL